MHFDWVKAFDLFLLDFDGLLVNTERLHFCAYLEMCERRGFKLKWDFDEYCAIAHQDADGLKKAIYASLPELYQQEPNWNQLYAEKKQNYLTLLKSGCIDLLPGVAQFLKSLAVARLKRCIVTHSPREQVDLIRQAHPILNTIPVWITRENYLNPKPAPDGYLKAIELLADTDDKIIGFEDTFRGVRALQGTSAMPVLICARNHPQLQDPAVQQVTHFSSLIDIPKKFGLG